MLISIWTYDLAAEEKAVVQIQCYRGLTNWFRVDDHSYVPEGWLYTMIWNTTVDTVVLEITWMNEVIVFRGEKIVVSLSLMPEYQN